MDDNLHQAQYNFIKLVICLQASLELLDELKSTPYYRHEIKKAVNSTTKVLEHGLKNHYKFVDDKEKEETYISIARATHEILDTSLEELFNKGFIPLGE